MHAIKILIQGEKYLQFRFLFCYVFVKSHKVLSQIYVHSFFQVEHKEQKKIEIEAEKKRRYEKMRTKTSKKKYKYSRIRCIRNVGSKENSVISRDKKNEK